MVRKCRKRSCVALILLAIALFLCSCGKRRSTFETWKDGDPAFVPFPVYGLAVSADNRFVAARVNEKMGDRNAEGGRATYIVDLKTGQHRHFKSDVEFLAFSDHKFASVSKAKTSTPIIVLEGLETWRSIAIGSHSGGWMNSRLGKLIFATGWEEQGQDFNELTFIDPERQEIQKMQTGPSASFGFCSLTGKFYVGHESEGHLSADEFNADGMRIRTIPYPIGLFSSDCRYVASFNALFRFGPESWVIFGADNFNKLVNFPWKDDATSDLRWFQSWNPRKGNLLLMHSAIAGASMTTTDIFDVREMKVVKSWPWFNNSTEPPVVWSGDGNAIVTVRDHHIVFDPIAVP